MEQTTFLHWAFCIIMMPKGQVIHWNLLSVGRGKPKIAGADCHTVGLGCSVQLCSEPLSVCHLTDCRMTANLSGASSPECGLKKHATGNLSPDSFQKHGGQETECVQEPKCAAALNSFSKMYSSFDYHNATMAEFKAGNVQLQIWRETTPCLTSEERNNGRGKGGRGEETVNSRAVLINYQGKTLINTHPPLRVITSCQYQIVFKYHKNMHKSWMHTGFLYP